jgi:hypothetical protein
MINLKYLVSGMPRSGTVYMARLLSSAGVLCGHESIFTAQGIDYAKEIINGPRNPISSHCSYRDDSRNWSGSQIADSSYLSVPFLDNELLKDTKIIHVIRDPIKVVSSLYFDLFYFSEDDQAPYRNFLYKFLPELEQISDEIERTLAFYIQWNNLIEEKSKGKEYFLIKVENAVNLKLFEFLNVPFPQYPYENKKANSWGLRNCDLMLSQVPDGTIKNDFIQMIERYGY